MSIDPVVLASLTAAVSVLGGEYVKGVASEAGKSSWLSIKALLGWTTDPEPGEIPDKLSRAVTPEICLKLLDLLQNDRSGTVGALVGNLQNNGGKIVVTTRVGTINM